jgi:hypothetical protein
MSAAVETGNGGKHRLVRLLARRNVAMFAAQAKGRCPVAETSGDAGAICKSGKNCVMTIRVLSFLAMLLGLGAAVCAAQETGAVPKIRAEVARINAALPHYAKRFKSLSGLSLEGSEVTYYHEGDRLRKISAKLYGETYNAAADLYYEGDALLFAYQKVNRYDTQVGMQPPPKVVNSQEKRLYFSGGALAVLKIGQAGIEEGDVQWNEAEMEITELSDQLRAGFSRE